MNINEKNKELEELIVKKKKYKILSTIQPIISSIFWTSIYYLASYLISSSFLTEQLSQTLIRIITGIFLCGISIGITEKINKREYVIEKYETKISKVKKEIEEIKRKQQEKVRIKETIKNLTSTERKELISMLKSNSTLLGLVCELKKLESEEEIDLDRLIIELSSDESVEKESIQMTPISPMIQPNQDNTKNGEIKIRKITS